MQRQRKQSGYIYQRAGWWVLRYREDLLENGVLTRRQLAKKIEPVAPEHKRCKRPPAEIQKKADQLLQPLNNRTYTPEATQTLAQFVEKVYFPNISNEKRESTLKDTAPVGNLNSRPDVGISGCGIFARVTAKSCWRTLRGRMQL